MEFLPKEQCQIVIFLCIILLHDINYIAVFSYEFSSSSSPLLSLVTSTSEISHQPVHTYIQYDKGVDRTGRQGIEEIYSKHKVREEKKNNPQTMLLLGVQCATRKNTSATKST